MTDRMAWLVVVLLMLPACKSQPRSHYSTPVPVADPAAPAQPGPVVQPVSRPAEPKVAPASVASRPDPLPDPLKPVAPVTEPEAPAPPPEPEPKPATPVDPPSATTEGTAALDRGRSLLAAGRLVTSRRVLNEAMVSGRLSEAEADQARKLLMRINQTLIFSDRVIPGDSYARLHTVEAGQLMSRVARTYRTDWSFLSRLNGDLDARRVRVGQKLKVVPGPYHAVVDKSDHRLDLFIGKGPADPNRMFVYSFKVGLGTDGSTPVGLFEVKNRVTNPGWIHPRTGQHYDRNDKNNPIGEHWVGLRGLDAHTKNQKGYGLHGTIEPQSIGRDASMGCVRMLPQDIALVHSVMESGASRVLIQP
ncbi:MAG: L,D-transpeptidase family protein [Phycisphaeraceae bacterium]|nr:L,D-transpeptidase family protein [Phycisphaeraceae bacterium]